MTHRIARHPFAAILRHDQGRTLAWLARETGVSHQYVRAVAANLEKGSPRFRAACARAMGRPEGELFLHDDVSSASRAEDAPDPGSDSRAGIAAHRAYSPDQEAAIVHLA